MSKNFCRKNDNFKNQKIHFKGANDGNGGTFKSEAIRASLQDKAPDAILTAQQLYDWAETKFKEMDILYYSQK